MLFNATFNNISANNQKNPFYPYILKEKIIISLSYLSSCQHVLTQKLEVLNLAKKSLKIPKGYSEAKNQCLRMAY